MSTGHRNRIGGKVKDGKVIAEGRKLDASARIRQRKSKRVLVKRKGA
jgi:hypothetical protein